MIRKYGNQNDVVLVTLIFITFFLVSCASQPTSSVEDSPGFLMGIVHGFTIFFSLVGYLVGASFFLGAGGASAT